MATTVPFHYVDVRAFSYATEDERRVEGALETLLPADQPIDRATTEGHHGDRIVVFSARVEDADGIRTVIDRLRAMDDFDRLEAELEDRVTEDCEIYLTLDKQQAFRGTAARGRGITVRAKIEAYPATRERALENVRPLFEDDR